MDNAVGFMYDALKISFIALLIVIFIAAAIKIIVFAKGKKFKEKIRLQHIKNFEDDLNCVIICAKENRTMSRSFVYDLIKSYRIIRDDGYSVNVGDVELKMKSLKDD